MKAFLLFAGNSYPVGGWRDIAGAFDTLEEAVAQADEIGNIEWWHVVCLATGLIVKHGKRA